MGESAVERKDSVGDCAHPLLVEELRELQLQPHLVPEMVQVQVLVAPHLERP